MLKKEITFTDFNDEEVTEVHYFHLSKTELIELEVEHQGGLQRNMEAVIDAKDAKTLIEEFKKIIFMSYGKKSPDGRRFEKSPELSHEFSQTAAYDALFMELAMDDNAGSTFISGLIPKDLAAQVEAEKNDIKNKMADALGTKSSPTAEAVRNQE